MRHTWHLRMGFLLVVAATFGGCWPEQTPVTPVTPQAPSLSPKSDVAIVTEQASAHPSLHKAEFLSLADFEHRSDQDVKRQLDWFRLENPNGRSRLALSKEAVSGEGSLEVRLARGEAIRFSFPETLDASDYWLIQLSVWLPQRRDDLQLTFHSRTGSWSSPRAQMDAGWNDLPLGLTEMKRLTNVSRFDVRSITGITIQFTDLAAPLLFRLDDILLLNNARRIDSTPAKLGLWLWGGDYALKLPGWAKPLRIERGPDGLWRIGEHHPAVTCGMGSSPTRPASEFLGVNRLGQLKIIERNRVRLRMESTWRFPLRYGAWMPVSMRYLRCRWTFYPDGRWVTELAMNNSGGELMKSLRVKLPIKAAWSARKTSSNEWLTDSHVGPMRRWCYLLAPPATATEMYKSYLTPAKLEVGYGKYVYVAGDVMGDAFDESQGCYVVGGRNGQCRFSLRSRAALLAPSVVRVLGPWTTAPTIRVTGGFVDTVELLADGSALFRINMTTAAKVNVEVRGSMQVIPRPAL